MIMLKNLNPLLSADLIYVLQAMGHGDEIVIVDANFPAESSGPQTVHLDGVSATAALEAVLSVMPLDTFVDEACFIMGPVGEPDREEPIFAEFRAIIARAEGPQFVLGRIERFDFYARASEAFAILATGERRLYGNIILKKGIVRPQ
jgi:L-fucose mutarotase